ncbi:MAG: hypothetical protein K0U59_06825 [Gammaproteobacteria bacterium]|nr:hypothetical protein [Gammaproteobacteria bacterium]
MSIGTWEPAKPTATQARKEIHRNALERMMASVQDAKLTKDLNAEDRAASYLMGLPAQQWLEESEAWNNNQLWQLIQFFTLAEMQLPEWRADAESPVIPLAKALRQRKTPLNKEQLQWIKQHSNNRYLPYGPL